MNYGALPDDWFNLDLLGYGQDLLPVVSNLTAVVSPTSTLKDIGKVPSKYNRENQIVGIAKWTEKRARPREIESWSKNPDYGICIQTRYVRALDIDVTDKDLVQKIVEFISAQLNWLGLPTRTRNNSSKCLLAFCLKGEFPKRIMKVKDGIIEFLANGQQFVAIGTHPSNVRYEWDWQGRSDFPELQLSEFEEMWAALSDRFAIEPPSEATLRNAPTGEYAAPDDIAQYLCDEGYVTGIGKEGQHFLKCPFAHEHTDPEADGTATAYLPAGNRDYAQGHFSCLHAHCGSRADEEFLDAVGYRLRDFDVIKEDSETKNDEHKANRFKLLDYAEFANRKPPGYIIQNVLPRAELGVIFGASTAGKSFVSLDMSFAISRGVSWNGHETTQGRVVYIAAEGAGAFSKRVKAYMIEHNITGKLPFQVVADSPNFFLKEDAIDLAKAILQGGKADVIFSDTLAQTSVGANENSAEDIAKILSNIKGIHKATGALIIPVHHEGKDENKGARGSSALKAAADVEICISRKGEERMIKITKQKDGEDGLEFGFKLKKVQLDLEIDSCVVEYTNAPLSKRKRPDTIIRKMGARQQYVYDIFMELNAGGRVLHAALRDEISKRMPPDTIKNKAKRLSNYMHSITSLIENGHLQYDDKECSLFAPLEVE